MFEMAMLAEKKNSDLVSEPSMHFWGIVCHSGKHYSQVAGQRFRITMAVLDPKSAPKDNKIDKVVSLLVKRDGCEFLLCVLKHDEILQVSLNLVFDKGENVTFSVRGHGNICLSGYQLTESEKEDESGYLCPLSEENTEKKNDLPKNETEVISPKSKKKAKREKDFVTIGDKKILKSWDSMSNRQSNGAVTVLEFDSESDESDEDFSVGEESSESRESEEFDEEELEEELEEEIMKLNEDDDDEDGDDEVVEMEPEGQAGSSRKRKLEKKSQVQENSFYDEDSSDSDIMQLPTSVTPIPKKTAEEENNSEKKKSKKKKKKLNESTSSEKSVTESTPKSTKKGETTPGKNSVRKLEGGIEVQDVILGKGPVATKGKMVHVFYVGRFQNKEIFDSRLPGKKPFSFKLGAQQVIKGWDVGLEGMNVGGKRKLKIPPSMGYGNSRIEGIPPNSTLFFLVELQAVS